MAYEAPPGLAWCDWAADDGSVSVFHPLTGETHLLDAWSAECLDYVSRTEGADVEAVAAHAAGVLGVAPASVRADVAGLIRQLEALELVYYKGPCTAHPAGHGAEPRPGST